MALSRKPMHFVVDNITLVDMESGANLSSWQMAAALIGGMPDASLRPDVLIYSQNFPDSEALTPPLQRVLGKSALAPQLVFGVTDLGVDAAWKGLVALHWFLELDHRGVFLVVDKRGAVGVTVRRTEHASEAALSLTPVDHEGPAPAIPSPLEFWRQRISSGRAETIVAKSPDTGLAYLMEICLPENCVERRLPC